MTGYRLNVFKTRPLVVALCFAMPLAAATGCTPPEQKRAVEAADGFTAAIEAGDGATACALLAPVTRAELEKSAGRDCVPAVLAEAVAAGARDEARTYGAMSQVVYNEDVLFVGRFGDRWRVVAAACAKQPAAPYDCRISGR